MKKKLLVISSTFPRWQDDTDPPFVFELTRRLADYFQISVLAPHFPGSLLNETMGGMDVYRFRYFLKKFETLAGSSGILPTLKKNKLNCILIPFFIIGEIIALYKLTKKIKPEIIHAHWLLPQGLIAALVHIITGVPYVITVHGGDIYGLQGKIPTALKCIAIRYAASITAVSKDIRKRLKQLSITIPPIEVIPMGVDSELFHFNKKDQKLREKFGINGPFLLFVGRLTEKKGVQYLISALPEVFKHFPETKLLIIGTGEQEKELKQYAKDIGLDQQIIFAGAISNHELPKFFATADIFIGPSIKTADGDTEGFGLTFVEAAMAGCIVVGTDVGGIADVIQNGKTGFLIKEKSPEAITQVLLNILQKQVDVSAIRDKARQEMISQFNWKLIEKKYRRILDSY